MTPLSRGAFRLLEALKVYARGKDHCFPLQKTLATRLKVTTRTVRRWLIELEAAGAVSWRRRTKTSAVYTVNPNVRSNRQNKTVGILRLEMKMSTQAASNVRSDVRSDVRSIPYIPEATLNPPKSPPSQEVFHMPAMPAFYQTADEQKLWRLAWRWARENRATMQPRDVAVVMRELEAAGVLERTETAILPLLPVIWPKASPILPAAAETPPRKPAAIAGHDLSEIRRKIDSERAQ